MTAQTKAIKIAQFLASSAEYLSTKTHRKKKNIAIPNNADANNGDPNKVSFIVSLHTPQLAEMAKTESQ